MVAQRLRGASAAAEIILRSGCYLTNDHGMYEQAQRAEVERGQMVPDQHPLAVGDLVGLGCSHPCTTFDKWKYIYRIDDSYTVTDIITTLF